MNIKNDKPLHVNPDIVFREEEEGAFLFHPETGELKCLNSMGRIIWSMCDGQISADLLEEKISNKYPSVPRDEIHNDLITFLEELFAIGYIGHSTAVVPPA
ncbi:MAG: PqqD family peptide modification chaperone [Deltaproteobacteria bacterium]|nr:PqqD family peptide modification chaperone [Deltaproteobacteria bacterium]